MVGGSIINWMPPTCLWARLSHISMRQSGCWGCLHHSNLLSCVEAPETYQVCERIFFKKDFNVHPPLRPPILRTIHNDIHSRYTWLPESVLHTIVICCLIDLHWLATKLWYFIFHGISWNTLQVSIAAKYPYTVALDLVMVSVPFFQDFPFQKHFVELKKHVSREDLQDWWLLVLVLWAVGLAVVR